MLAAWPPVSTVRAKNRPPRADGATMALSALYPDWESRELNAHTAPRSSSTTVTRLDSRTTTTLEYRGPSQPGAE